MNRYRTTLRPPGFGGLPIGVTYRYVELPPDAPNRFGYRENLPTSRHRYGVIETGRPLTPEELRHFDIEPL